MQSLGFGKDGKKILNYLHTGNKPLGTAIHQLGKGILKKVNTLLKSPRKGGAS